MPRYEHLIIGGGLAGYATAQAIREIDRDASIAMLSEEPQGPYDRTALSKGLWQGKVESDIIFDTAELGIQLIPRRAARIKPAYHAVIDQSGNTLEYGKLLLATGVRPRILPFAPGTVHYLRTLEQYHEIRRLADEGRTFLVIGGGFLGAELAASLCTVGNQVTMVFPEAGIGSLMFPGDLSNHLTEVFRKRGVNVLPYQSVKSLGWNSQGGVTASLMDGKVVRVDEVVAAIGSIPEIELAWVAAIGVGNGIIVDEYFRTDAPDVFAAGDVANYPDPIFGRRRVEHEDQAVQSGRHAGLAMAGEGAPYSHLPLFYSDLFDYGYEAVGNLSSTMRTFSQWEELHRKGVTYYLDESSMIRGVLLWNTWGMANQARGLLSLGTRAAPSEQRLPMVVNG